MQGLFCRGTVGATLAGAQDSSPVFEVASIKPADPEFNGTSFNWLNGRGLRVRGATLRALITYAYGIRDSAFRRTGVGEYGAI